MKFNLTYIRYIVIAGLILAHCAVLQAQDLQTVNFEQIKTENIKRVKGLSQNMVNAIIQDDQGYLWFGTWDGLNQFDGYDFRIYNKLNGMSNTTINTLLKDDEGIIWAGTQDGLNRLDIRTKEINVFRHQKGERNCLSSNTINHLFLDNAGYIWISTIEGLDKYDKEKHVFSHFDFHTSDADSIRTNWINKVIQDREGLMWIATRYGLFMFDAANVDFKPFFHDPDVPGSISSDDVNDVYEDKEGNIWAGTRNGLNLFINEEEGFKKYYHTHSDANSLSNDDVKVIYEDSRGTLWIGTGDKLNMFDKKSEHFIHFSNSGKNTSISNNDINCIFEDDMGSVWVGTYNGVNKVNIGLSKFNYYHRDPDNPLSLSSDIVHTVFKDTDGLVWIGTSKGINILHPETNSYTRLHHYIDEYTDIAEERIRTLRKDKKGNVWIGTDNIGLLKYDPVNREYKHYYADENDQNTISSNSVLCLLEDHLGHIWLGTDRGVNALHPDSAKIRSWMHNPRDINSLSSNQVWIIYEDSKNNLWFGTDNGLNLYQRETDNFVSYTYDPDNPHSISANPVYGIYEDSKHNYWIGTMGGGLNHFDPQANKFTQYNEEDGLPNNVVYITLEDRNGNLWLTTNWGMSKFNPASLEFINYDIRDGLQGNEFNGGAWYHADDGEMFFGGMDGLNSFIPEEIRQNDNIPRIVITEFKKFNEPLAKSLQDGDTIRLNYDDNFFSLEFSALDFTNPAKNKYRFVLENYDEDWNYRDANRRIAEYTRVEPGSYIFRVTGSNNDGIWNEEGMHIYIIILPPWWDTLIFRIIFVALVFAILWSFIYWRIKNIKKKHEVEKRVLAIEKELFDIQQKALQLQMNPHFIFNSLNAIQSFVIANNTDKAIHYLSKFSQLMRLILSNSRENSIPVKDELKVIQYYMDIERLRFDNKFDYLVEVDEKIDQEFMEIPPMIIQPFVENAILHGLIHKKEKGLIKLTLKLQSDFIFCTIEDNGVGRKKAEEIREASGIKRKSRGMLITRERLEILNKQSSEKFSVNIIDLTDDEGEAIGTRVEINILYFDD